MKAEKDLHHNGKERIERYLKTIEDSKEITPVNKGYIIDFFKLCNAQGLSNARLCKTLWLMRNLGTWIGKKDFRKATKQDIIELVNFIQNKYNKHNTILDYNAMLKKFYKHTFGNGLQYTDSVSWIKLTSSKEKKDPSSMLSEDDILRLIQAQNMLNSHWARTRNKALISFMYDSGVRVGELLSMKIGDIKENGDLWHITVRGKTGQRTFPIYTSVPYLKEYLMLHPKPQDREAYLWCSFNNPNKNISYTKVVVSVQRASTRANIDKPVNPHNFRHSAVSRDSVFMNDQMLKKKFGWSSSSRQLGTYSHLRIEDLDNSLKQRYGLDKTEIETQMLIKICPSCSSENKPHEMYCQVCKKPLDIKEALKLQQKNQALEELTVLLLKEFAQTNPEIKIKFKQLIARHNIEDIL